MSEILLCELLNDHVAPCAEHLKLVLLMRCGCSENLESTLKTTTPPGQLGKKKRWLNAVQLQRSMTDNNAACMHNGFDVCRTLLNRPSSGNAVRCRGRTADPIEQSGKETA